MCINSDFIRHFCKVIWKKEVKAQKSNKYIFFLLRKEFGLWKNCLKNIEKLTAVAFDVDNWHRFSRCSPSMSWLWATTWMIRPPPPSHARHLCTAQSCILTISCTYFDSLPKQFPRILKELLRKYWKADCCSIWCWQLTSIFTLFTFNVMALGHNLDDPATTAEPRAAFVHCTKLPLVHTLIVYLNNFFRIS